MSGTSVRSSARETAPARSRRGGEPCSRRSSTAAGRRTPLHRDRPTRRRRAARTPRARRAPARGPTCSHSIRPSARCAGAARSRRDAAASARRRCRPRRPDPRRAPARAEPRGSAHPARTRERNASAAGETWSTRPSRVPQEPISTGHRHVAAAAFGRQQPGDGVGRERVSARCRTPCRWAARRARPQRSARSAAVSPAARRSGSAQS